MCFLSCMNWALGSDSAEPTQSWLAFPDSFNFVPTEGEDGESAPALSEEEKREKRLEEGIGVPHLVLDSGVHRQPRDLVLQWDKLPSAEEVRAVEGRGQGFITLCCIVVSTGGRNA